MALELRANTAVDVLIGPFVDDGDGDTPDTDATLVVELSKNGQALATKNEGTNPSHDAAGTVDGYYNCQLDTTDTNTEGNLVLVVHHADDLPVRHEYNVLAEAAWDSMFVAKDDGFMNVNVHTIGRADAQETEADNFEAACAAYSVTRGLTGTALPAAVADADGGLPIRSQVVLATTIGSDGRGTTSCRLVAGSDNNDAYIGMRIIIDDDAGDLEYVSRTITDYVATNKVVTWTPAITEDAEDGGLIWIVPGDTATAPTLATILADTNELQADDVPTLIAALPTAVEIQAEMEENGASILDTLRDDLADGGRLDLLIDAIKTAVDSTLEDTDGTDGVAIAAGGIAAAQFAAGAIDAAALNADAVTEFWAKVVEDDDAANYTAKDVLSIMLAVLAGVTATDGSVLKTPDGTTTRVTATINASQERTAMSLVPSN